MKTLGENQLSSGLAKPLGEKSLSSSLAMALKAAQVILSIMFAVILVAAIFGISVAILVAIKIVPAQMLNGSGTLFAAWTVAIPYLVYVVVSLRCALLIVRRLQAVFASLVANQPFLRANVAHLRAIWVMLVVIEISRISAWVLMHGLTAVFASTTKMVFPTGLGDPIDLVRWFIIFVVLILADIFRQGAQLREETELTV